MITIGTTVIHEEDLLDVRWAIRVALKEQAKVVKKMEDMSLDTREATARDGNLRRFLRLIDPTGQIDGVDEAERQKRSKEKQEEMPFTGDPDALDTTFGTWAARRLDDAKVVDDKVFNYVVEREEDGAVLGYYVTEEEASSAAGTVMRMNAANAEAEAAANNPATSSLAAEVVEQEVERVLIHEPATGELFQQTVRQADLDSCKSALAVAEGKGRREAIEKRIAVLEGRPEGAYDLTGPRRQALDALINSPHHTGDVTSRTSPPAPDTRAKVAKKVADWLFEQELALLGSIDESPIVTLTEAGVDLARQLGYGPQEPVGASEAPETTTDTPEGSISTQNESAEVSDAFVGVSQDTQDAVQPNDDDFGGPVDGYEEEEPAGVGAATSFDGLDDGEELL